jgi:hypothetical protein
MAVYPGRNGVIYMSTSGSGTASSVLKLNKWSMNRATDKIDVTAFGDANKTYVQGLPDIKGSFEGFWDDTESKPFTGAASTDGVKLYIYPSSTSVSKYWYGPAWLDCSMDEDVKGAVTIKADFAANGSWGNTF